MLVWLLLSIDHADKRHGDIRTRTTSTPPVCESLFTELLGCSWQLTRSVHSNVCFLKLQSSTKPRMHASTGTSPEVSLLAFAKASTWVFFSKPTPRLKKPSAGMKTDSHILLHTTALPLPHCVSHRSETNNMPDEREDAPGRASRGPSRRQRDSWMLRPGVRMQ